MENRNYKSVSSVVNGKTINLRIEYTDIESPRTMYDGHLGKMICWEHNRYVLGDTHSFNNPEELLLELINRMEGKEDALQKYWEDLYGEYRAVEVDGEWYIVDHCADPLGGDYSNSYDTKEDAEDELEDKRQGFLDDCTDDLEVSQLLEVLSQDKDLVLLPLYLYEHSGITMNTTGFSCQWDSSSAGFIYGYVSDLKEMSGYNYDNEQEWIELATSNLMSEVKVYDQYLTGDVYGFILEELDEHGEVIHDLDSCWGFYGTNFDTNGVKDHLEEEYHHLVDLL